MAAPSRYTGSDTEVSFVVAVRRAAARKIVQWAFYRLPTAVRRRTGCADAAALYGDPAGCSG